MKLLSAWIDGDKLRYSSRIDGTLVVKTATRRYFSPGFFLTDQHSVEFQNYNVCILDIETDSRLTIDEMKAGNASILSASILSLDKSERWIRATAELGGHGEGYFLNGILDELARYDLIIGWNSDDFDKTVLEARCQKLGLSLGGDYKRLLWLDYKELFRRYHVPEDGSELDSFSLQSVTEACLKRGKLGSGHLGAKTYELWANDRQTLLDYNAEDCNLIADLEAKYKYLEAFFAVCKICRTLPETRSLQPGCFVDSHLRLVAKKHHRDVPRKDDRPASVGKMPGAYVKEPAKREFRGVSVCDFSSFYPSMMRSYNIGTGSIVPDGKILNPYGSLASERLALTTIGLVETVKQREGYAALAAQGIDFEHNMRLSSGVKRVVNSYFGVVGNEWLRWYDPEAFKAITQSAAEILKFVISICPYEVIYADTDSLYMLCSQAQAIQFAPEAVEAIRRKWPGLESEFCVKLAYEKTFKKIAFLGAKKYAGVVENYKGSGKSYLEKKGLEVVRRDSNVLCRELMSEILRIYERTDVMSITDVYDTVNAIKNKTFSTDDFDSLAKKLNTKDGYKRVVVTGKKPTLRYNETGIIGADRAYIWDEYVYAPTKRLLESIFPNVDMSVFESTYQPRLF